VLGNERESERRRVESQIVISESHKLEISLIRLCCEGEGSRTRACFNNVDVNKFVMLGRISIFF